VKTRFFRVVWNFSMLWLGATLYVTISVSDSERLPALIILGLPSIAGLTATYVATGALFYPRDRQDR